MSLLFHIYTICFKIIKGKGSEYTSGHDNVDSDDESLIDVLLLNEDDIAGASLNGKDPSELN